MPGLGDSRSYGQNIALQAWRLFGLKPHYFPLGWADKEDFSPKLTRLLDKIDRLSRIDNKVSLVGVSAGASAVLAAMAARKNIAGVVCVVGKIHNPQTVSDYIYRSNPAFKQSMNGLKDDLKKLDDKDRNKIVSIHPLKDKTVPIEDTIIRGAREKTIPVRGHVFSIFYILVLAIPTMTKILRSLR